MAEKYIQTNAFDGRRFVKIANRHLPIANVSKIMKKSISENGKISKEAKKIMQKSASEFIAIITCRAKTMCEEEARKTITGEDLIRAMEDLDMAYYAGIAYRYYNQYKIALDQGKIKKNGNIS